jgi:hypothetical protein
MPWWYELASVAARSTRTFLVTQRTPVPIHVVPPILQPVRYGNNALVAKLLDRGQVGAMSRLQLGFTH